VYVGLIVWMKTQRNLKVRDQGRYCTGANNTHFYMKFDTSEALATKGTTTDVICFRWAWGNE